MDNYEYFERLRACRSVIDSAKSCEGLSNDEKAKLKAYQEIISSYERSINLILASPEDEQKRTIQEMELICTRILKDVRNIIKKHRKGNVNPVTSTELSPTGAPEHTSDPNTAIGQYTGGSLGPVDPTSEEKTKKNILFILKMLGIAALTFLIGIGIGRCSKKDAKKKADTTLPDKTISDLGTMPSTTALEELTSRINSTSNINDVDLLNNEVLEEYAKYLKGTYSLDDISFEETIDAIRLANIDLYENKSVFNDVDDITKATITAGKIGCKIGSDELVKKNPEADYYLKDTQVVSILQKQKGLLSITAFDDAKTEQGYDLYKLCEICIKKYKDKDDDYIAYARVLNEIMAQFQLNYSIANEAPLSTYYMIIGLYNTVAEELANDPALKLGTIYGVGNNDNRGGHICVEELSGYCTPGNENNIFYNPNGFIVQKFVTKGRTRS